MVLKFLKDIRGSYAVATVIAMVPIMGGLALAIDYTEMNRQRQATMNALDAACIATGREVAAGTSETELKARANDFFAANLGPVDPEDATFSLTLPTLVIGGGTLRCRADLVYDPYFYPVFKSMLDGDRSGTRIRFSAQSEVRLKNTLEIALVLDNSGSMDQRGKGSGSKRIDLLKKAAKQLVDTIAAQGALVKQINKPVQFALVPFAASVNVGPENKDSAWMDLDGASPIHHENFDWATFTEEHLAVKKKGGVYRKDGDGWGDEEGQIVTRFTLFEELQRVTDEDWECTDWDDGECDDWDKVPTEYDSFATWAGCVEARPYPYNVNDAAPSPATPATLFVPMFAPDESDRRDKWGRPESNSWWRDVASASSAGYRQRYMPKYFTPAPMNGGDPVDQAGLDEGPNASCTTRPITPLSDVSSAAGLNAVKAAIDAMQPLGGTNVPEGMAWGWRAISGRAPFTQGRGDDERGNDKVVIVLTDGENTYYTPGSLGYADQAGNKSIYSSYGYLKPFRSPYSDGRLFLGTGSDIKKNDFSNDNYTAAMNEAMKALCGNVKNDEVVLMTVALDLDSGDKQQKKQIEALKECASYSRFKEDRKLFWNTNGGDLEKTFKEIADELSNLRIVG